jgi:hypothetical protein
VRPAASRASRSDERSTLSPTVSAGRL